MAYDGFFRSRMSIERVTANIDKSADRKTAIHVFDANASRFMDVMIAAIALAILLPVVPFALEMMALRRLTTAAFGTLMALEPGFAMIVGLVILNQVPGALGVVGICLVVAAGIGAARTGARAASPVPVEVG